MTRVAMLLGYAPEFGHLWSSAAQHVAEVVPIVEVLKPTESSSPTQSPWLFDRHDPTSGTVYEIVVERHRPRYLFDPLDRRTNARRFESALGELELRLGPINLIHGHFYSSVVNATMTRWPVVFTEHSSLFGRAIRSPKRGASDRRSLAMAKGVYSRAAASIAISSEQREHIAATIGVEADRLIHNPVGADGTRAVGRHNANGSELSIVTLGRLASTKRHELLLRALDQLRSNDLNVKLEIIGSGALEPQLHALRDELGLTDVVSFRGRVPHDEAMRALATASLSVTASDVESFGLPTVEALLIGTPVCSTPVGFAAEMTALDGVELADDLSLPALVEALQRSVTQPRSVSTADREWLDTKVSPRAVAQQLGELYREVR